MILDDRLTSTTSTPLRTHGVAWIGLDWIESPEFQADVRHLPLVVCVTVTHAHLIPNGTGRDGIHGIHGVVQVHEVNVEHSTAQHSTAQHSTVQEPRPKGVDINTSTNQHRRRVSKVLGKSKEA